MTDDAPATATDDTGTTEPDGGRLDAAERRTAVRERYARIATESPSSCCGDTESCCGDTESCCGDTGTASDAAAGRSAERGYSDDDLAAVAPGANLGLGCGNPTALAGLAEGDTVLDLGSGGGFDCFLAAREVGPDGRVIGVDMTPEMVETARGNVESNDATNVEFRLGEIEHLPVADGVVDVVLSNCVVNLSPDKPGVFREAYRVLRPGGRLAVSDVVATADLPSELRADPESVAACLGGASTPAALESMLSDAGFTAVSIEPKADSAEFVREWDDERDLADYLLAATIEAEKPATAPPPSREE